MVTSNTCVADPVDTVHHVMDSTVRSHHVYKSMIRVFTSNRRTTCPREGAYQPIHTMNLQYIAVIKDSPIVGRTLSEIYSQITWYYVT